MALSACIGLWLTAHGYEPPQRDAVLKQLWTESRFEPCIVGKGGAYLAQWTGPRLRRLHARFGPGCPSWEQQMQFLDWELRTEPSYRAFWSAKPGREFKVLRLTFGMGQEVDG